MKIGIALGGGVARGFYHIGVLKALEKLRIKISVISGTSIGAIIGGLYALKPSAKELEEKIFGILSQYPKELALLKTSFSSTNVEAKTAFLEKWFDIAKEFYIWNLRLAKPSLVDFKVFLKIFKNLFADSSFSDCKIPLLISAVDASSGEMIYLNNGHLYRAILASASYPGFLPPLKMDDKLLIDGGVLLPVPVKIIKPMCDFVIAINLESSGYKFPHIRNAMDVMNLADRIRYKKIIEDSLEGADFIISPDLENFPWGDFTRSKELMQKGEADVMQMAKPLKKALKFWRFKSIKNLFSFHLPLAKH